MTDRDMLRNLLALLQHAVNDVDRLGRNRHLLLVVDLESGNFAAFAGLPADHLIRIGRLRDFFLNRRIDRFRRQLVNADFGQEHERLTQLPI
ncbi:hypothetical protein D3C73_1492890 [compost metagenome]